MKKTATRCPIVKMFNKKQFKCGIVFILFMPFILFSETINDSKLSNTPSCSQVSYNNVARLPNMSSRPIAPNWVERKKYWKEQFKDSFSPPKVGTYKKIKLINGVTQYGKIIELTDKTLKIRIDNKITILYKRYQLAPISRAVFFESDFIDYNANLKVDKEIDRYHLKFKQFLIKQKQNVKRYKKVAKIAKIRQLINSSDLLLIHWTWRCWYDSVIVKGQVRNISGHDLYNIEALVSFYSAGGELITYESSLVEYNPILPNQITPFSVFIWKVPNFKTIKISFKTFLGKKTTLLTKDKLNNLDKLEGRQREIHTITVGYYTVIDKVAVGVWNVEYNYIKRKSSLVGGLTTKSKHKYLLVHVMLRNTSDKSAVYMQRTWKNTKIFDNLGNVRNARFSSNYLPALIVGHIDYIKLNPNERTDDIIIFNLPANSAQSFRIESDPCFLKKTVGNNMKEISHNFFNIKFTIDQIK